MSTAASNSAPDHRWWRLLNRYHWFVLIDAALGWLFDCLDQQLFNLARKPALDELLKGTGANPVAYGFYVTGIFIAGWATGGVVFGVMGDKIGRAKTMVITILLYSAFTGLSALSQGFWDFAAYRFLTGLGVGGEFAVGVALLAEVMPDKARAGSLGLLQALSAVGNVGAAIIGYVMFDLEQKGSIGSAWRWLFVFGALPALLALVVRARLKEPERWQRMKDAGQLKHAGSYARLFGHARWRRNALIGLVLAVPGVIGFWGIGVFSADLVRMVVTDKTAASVDLFFKMSGAFFGMLVYTEIARRIGRRPAFAICFTLAMAATIFFFQRFDNASQIYWMSPLLGFCQMGIFALYAIYFPELFPTELRSTGTSFCYNVGRYVAAAGVIVQGAFADQMKAGSLEVLRSIGSWTALVYLVGVGILLIAPETKDQPLPEDERGFAH